MKTEDIDQFNESIMSIWPKVQLKNICADILGQYIIPLYKKNRAAQYKTVLRDFVQSQNKNSVLN
jgi:hypothetical protein